MTHCGEETTCVGEETSHQGDKVTHRGVAAAAYRGQKKASHRRRGDEIVAERALEVAEGGCYCGQQEAEKQRAIRSAQARGD
eukprot:1208944-Pleurochrysis_carterae.AAC.1